MQNWAPNKNLQLQSLNSISKNIKMFINHWCVLELFTLFIFLQS